MQNRIVEITSEGAYLSVERGFLLITIQGEKAGKVAIDDIGALIIRGHSASFSANICSRLADANVPIVICGNNQAPASVIWPISGHFAQGLHMQAQADCKKPLRKRLWTHIIKSKITMQATVLKYVDLVHEDIQILENRVKAGDPTNQEAQAARKYWSRLMGNEFRRDRNQDGINAFLNYGYTVLRAATARSILAAGLHPSLSIHHQSRGNALRLADDLMEPFRPWVDLFTWEITQQADSGLILDVEAKKKLTSILTLDLQGPLGTSPLQTCLDRLAQSLVHVYLGDRLDLELPSPPIHFLDGKH